MRIEPSDVEALAEVIVDFLAETEDVDPEIKEKNIWEVQKYIEKFLESEGIVVDYNYN